ncbi:molybdopterin-synthase adenylyltransferase MoeB [bacterium]|nr:MAG: molybdopterin-synthase adenylyltransferase MoeB [bacterium]
MRAESLERYSRHLLMPEVGLAGQERLAAASVLCIGAGGLGSPVALYLAAAGVGHLGLVDDDVVERSNLQRQVLFGESSLGVPKARAAAERLRDLNPEVEVEAIEGVFDRSNALELVKRYDLVVDGTDNFPTRYLVNDACVLSGKTYVYGSIFRFDGQVSVFGHRAASGERGPCYRCIYPVPPPAGTVPSCAEGGVLGVLPGLVGILQAQQALLLLLGVGNPLIGRLLLVDALETRMRELRIERDPQCSACGDAPEIRELGDYENFCGIEARPDRDPGFLEDYGIGARELARMLNAEDGARTVRVVDVRERQEVQAGLFPGARHVPFSELAGRLHELDTSEDLVVVCRVAARAAGAVQLLLGHGFRNIRFLDGGLARWQREIDPEFPLY